MSTTVARRSRDCGRVRAPAAALLWLRMSVKVVDPSRKLESRIVRAVPPDPVLPAHPVPISIFERRMFPILPARFRLLRISLANRVSGPRGPPPTWTMVRATDDAGVRGFGGGGLGRRARGCPNAYASEYWGPWANIHPDPNAATREEEAAGCRWCGCGIGRWRKRKPAQYDSTANAGMRLNPASPVTRML